MDQGLWMKSLNFHGPLLLQTIINEEIEEPDNEVEKDKQNMCIFIKNKLHLLFKPADPEENSSKHDPSLIVPIEMFQNVSNSDRRDLFYKSIGRGSILILKIINDCLPDNYKLLVLYKQEDFMKLDDLSIVMYLPKLQAELDLAGGKLESNDFIRAAVCSCGLDDRSLNVTLDSNIIEDEIEKVKLGKIAEEDLPYYVKNCEVGSSYVEFLHRIDSFNNPNWAQDLSKVLNLDRKYLYSFLDGLDGKKYPAEEYGAALKKKQDLILSNAQYEKGLKCYEAAKFPDAFIFFNKALTIYPKNIEVLVSRGKLYANINNLRKAFMDMEKALSIDPKHEEASKHMSVFLVAVARMHMEKNDYEKAQESLDYALDLDSTNQDAIAAIDEINQKSSDPSTCTSGENLNKTMKMLDKKKSGISSGSGDGSPAKVDDVYASFLSSATRSLLSSLKRKHHVHDRDKEKKSRHHHSHHKSRSKSPKRKLPDLA